MGINIPLFAFFAFCFLIPFSVWAQDNPFLKPGSNRQKAPVISKPAPPPPKPIPRNPNLEFRGYYEFRGEWKVALFDKAKNQGFWLSEGEKVEGLDAEIESFNPETEAIKLKGGMTLTLEKSDHKVLPVPSGQVKTPPPVPIPGKPSSRKATPKLAIPPPRISATKK